MFKIYSAIINSIVPYSQPASTGSLAQEAPTLTYSQTDFTETPSDSSSSSSSSSSCQNSPPDQTFLGGLYKTTTSFAFGVRDTSMALGTIVYQGFGAAKDYWAGNQIIHQRLLSIFGENNTLFANNEREISEAKEEMKKVLEDPQFAQFYDLIIGIAKDQIDGQEAQLLEMSPLLPGFIKDTLELNLAKAMAHLANEIAKNRENIPHFDQQPLLFNLLFHLYQKGESALGLERLLICEGKKAEDLFNKEMFNQITDLIVTQLFPEKIDSLIFPGAVKTLMRCPFPWFGYSNLGEWIYQKYVVEMVSDFLNDSFTSSPKEFVNAVTLVVKGKKYFDSLLSIESKREKLIEISGNKDFLPKMAEVLSRDLIKNLPLYLGDVEAIGGEILKVLGPKATLSWEEREAFFTFLTKNQLTIDQIRAWIHQKKGINLEFTVSENNQMLRLVNQKNAILLSRGEIYGLVASSLPKVARERESFSRLEKDFMRLSNSKKRESVEEETTLSEFLKNEDFSLESLIALSCEIHSFDKADLTSEQMSASRGIFNQRLALLLQDEEDKKLFEQLKESLADASALHEETANSFKALIEDSSRLTPSSLLACASQSKIFFKDAESLERVINTKIFLLSSRGKDLQLAERLVDRAGLSRGKRRLSDQFDLIKAIRSKDFEEIQARLKLENLEAREACKGLFEEWQFRRQQETEAIEFAQALLDQLRLPSRFEISFSTRQNLIHFLNNPTLTPQQIIRWAKENLFASLDEAENWRIDFKRLKAGKKLARLIDNRAAGFQVAENLGVETSSLTIDLETFRMVKALVGDLIGGEERHNLKDREFLRLLVEGVLLEMFTILADRNRPVEGKEDSAIVLIDKVFGLLGETYKKLKELPLQGNSSTLEQIKEAGKELSFKIMKEVVGIVERIEENEDVGEQVQLIAALDWIPQGAKNSLYQLVEEMVVDYMIKICHPLMAIGKDQAVVDQLKTYGVDKNSNEAYATLIIDAAIHKGLKIGLEEFSSQNGKNHKIVDIALEALKAPIDQLLRDEFEVATLLKSYSGSEQFSALFANLISTLKSDEAVEDLALIEKGIRNILLAPIHHLIHSLLRLEKNQPGFHQELVIHLLDLFVEQIEFQKTVKRGQSFGLLEKDFREAAGPAINPAIYPKSIALAQTLVAVDWALEIVLSDSQKKQLSRLIFTLLKEEKRGKRSLNFDTLTECVLETFPLLNFEAVRDSLFGWKNEKGETVIDLIRLDAENLVLHRKEHGFGTASKKFLRLLFPRGAESLTFVDESMRKMVWRVLEENLSLILSNLVDSLANCDFVNGHLVSAVEGVVRSLKNPAEAEPLPIQGEEVKGERYMGMNPAQKAKLLQIVNRFLPFFIDEFVPKLPLKQTLLTKFDLSKRVAEKLVETLEGALTQDFIESSLKNLFESLIDEKGKCKFADEEVLAEKMAEEVGEPLPTDLDLVETKLRQLMRELIDIGLKKTVLESWNAFQSKLDHSIKIYLGEKALMVKDDLDIVCNFIFFQVIGAFLALILAPCKESMVTFVANYCDRRRQTFLDPFTKIPKEEEGESNQWIRNVPIASEEFLLRLVSSLAGLLEKEESELLEIM